MKLIWIFSLLAVISLALIVPARAQTPTNASPRFPLFQYCEKERVQFCGDQDSLPSLGSCLMAHKNDISQLCQQDIDRFMKLREQAAARGGGALSSFGGPNSIGPPIPLITYDGRYSPAKISPPAIFKNGGSISAPVYKDGGDTVSLSLSGSDFHFGSPVTLDSGFQVPTDLYRVEIGSRFYRQYNDMKSLGFGATVGYAGDEPLQNSTDVTYALNASYGFKGGSDASYWLLYIYFSNNSPLGDFIPIPGVDYVYRTSNFTGMFGFPVTSLQWTPIFPWAFSFSLFGPLLQTEIDYGSIEKLQFFTMASYSMESYLPSQRTNSLDRLTYQELRTGLGLRTLVTPFLLGELQGGWASNRYLYLGQHLFIDDGGQTQLADDWYVTWTLKARF